LALNRLGEDAHWDPRELALELGEIVNLDSGFDLSLAGFEMGEIDVLLNGDEETGDDEADALPDVDPAMPPITRSGDLWLLDRHRVLCADATDTQSFDRLMNGHYANLIVADPPYNVPIDGHVSGLGKVRHAEFAQASGEMTDDQFEAFLSGTLERMARHCANGAVAFIFMDWRHLPILDRARRGGFSEQLNLCVWTKTNGGMGSLYRSQHELVAVYKKGKAPHINNVALGRHGRNRTNVWSYPGLNAFGSSRDQRLRMHPTMKPVALVKDAILDCSNHGGIVLDAFLGSGTTLIAAERAGRCCFGMEIDPRYVDVTLRRFQKLTGIEPVHAESGATFAEVGKTRAKQDPTAGASGGRAGRQQS
jgi:DNA modification methylase